MFNPENPYQTKVLADINEALAKQLIDPATPRTIDLLFKQISGLGLMVFSPLYSEPWLSIALPPQTSPIVTGLFLQVYLAGTNPDTVPPVLEAKFEEGNEAAATGTMKPQQSNLQVRISPKKFKE